MTAKTKQWPGKSLRTQIGTACRSETDKGERWAIVWDTHRRLGLEGRSIAREKLESGALQRARHMLRIGFIVYEVRQPSGSVHLTENTLRQRLGGAAAAT